MTSPRIAPMGEQELIALDKAVAAYNTVWDGPHGKDGIHAGNVAEIRREAMSAALRAAASPRLAGSGEPVAWRWKPKDATTWIYDPTQEWLAAHRREVDCEPLYAHPAPSESVGWQTIDSAPKDGTLIDLWYGTSSGGQRAIGYRWDRQIYGGAWSDGRHHARGWRDREFVFAEHATHWMPLPAPPTSHASHHSQTDENAGGKS